MARQQPRDAAPHYRDALRIRPESSRAHLGLGAALIASGDVQDGIAQLKIAGSGQDVAVREQATEMLRRLEKP